MQGISVPPLGTLIPSNGTLFFPSTLLITWKFFLFETIPSTNLAKASELCLTIFILWLLLYEWIEMTCSLCCFSRSLRHSRFSPIVYIQLSTFSIQREDISAPYARRHETSDLCLVTQKAILVFGFEMFFEDNSRRLTFLNCCKVSFKFNKFWWNYMRAR